MRKKTEKSKKGGERIENEKDSKRKEGERKRTREKEREIVECRK